MVDERIRLKDVATRVMKRMMNRLAASVFDAWYDEIREQVENREAAYRSVIIMMKLRMVQWCFKEWARKCVGIAQARTRESARSSAGYAIVRWSYACRSGRRIHRTR